MNQHMRDYQESVAWACSLMASPLNFVVLDTETTGLYEDAQIVQLAIIDGLGETLLNTLVKPTISIPLEASRIHGINDEHVHGAPNMSYVYDQIAHLVGDRQIVIYNAAYDVRLMRQSLTALTPDFGRLFDRDWPKERTHCAMLWYAQYFGEWNSYHGNYRFQRLPGGDHSALGDALATLRLIRTMSSKFKEETA